MALSQAVAPFLDILLVMFISLGSMPNCWRWPEYVMWERDRVKSGDTQFMDLFSAPECVLNICTLGGVLVISMN